MWNEITNNSYSNYIEKLISRIFLNIKQIIRLLFYIFYKRPKIIKVRKYIYSSNYGDWDNYKYRKYGYWHNKESKDRPRRFRIGKIIARIIIILLIILIVIYYPSYIKQILKILQTSINNISATIQSTIMYTQPIINSTWVFQFFSIVNQYRQSTGAPPLQYCPWLDNFANIRFETMVQNPAISHYGFDQDYNEYLSQYQDFLSVGEEVLYPNGYTPKDYVQYMQSNAPIHWEGLLNSNYMYYGYYIGYGPTYAIIGSCSVTEIPGPNINVPQYLQSHGCSVDIENDTWLVIELSNWCSESSINQLP